MAVRRMISKSLIDTDIFLDLSLEAKHLYFYLNIFADDDGLIGSPKRVARDAGVSIDAMKELKEKGNIIAVRCHPRYTDVNEVTKIFQGIANIVYWLISRIWCKKVG